MRKRLLFALGMIGIPCLLCIVFQLVNPDIRIGKGGNSLENRYLDKNILIEINGLYKSLDVEEYVLGVLAGTIPEDYDMEALKVQAVLIRTNVLKEMEEKGTNDAADLSYRYMPVEERKEMWGEHNYEKCEKRLERAVVKTAGKVVKDENGLIMALYHEVSIGKTVSAEEILGEDISYLQSVDSSHDVEAKHYMNIVSYTWEELEAMAKKNVKEENQKDEQSEDTTAQEGENQSGTVQIEESTEHGFVKVLSVNGISFTGQEAVDRFGLTSTNFYVEEIDGGVRFICLGTGSCLGVSQYGANYMALNGKTMEEIIEYYYQGVKVEYYKKK